MNRDDIIRMAQETGVTAERVRDLVNFAALVASAERERLAKVFDERNKYVDGWYDPHEPAEIIRGQA